MSNRPTCTWKCPFCGSTEFVFRETAIVMATGMIDENNEFTIDDVVGYEVIERDHAALCEGCQRAYDLAGTQGGKQ